MYLEYGPPEMALIEPYHGDTCLCESCCKHRDNRKPDSITDGTVDRETMKKDPFNDRGMSDL